MSVLVSKVGVTVTTYLLLASWWCGHTAADYESPWVAAQGARPEDLPASLYKLTERLAELEKGKEVWYGPHLISHQYSRLVISRGASVTLNCTVENAGNVTVSWTRGKKVLTINKLRFTGDARISPLHETGARDHSLRFSQVQLNDSGIYDCHVGTIPAQVARVKLVVIDAYSVIFGDSEVSVAVGGTLYLLCMVLQVSDIPEYILWYRDTDVLDYLRSTISVTTEEATRSSKLQVHNINFTDAGNYTCQPSNATPAFVIVKVFKDTNRKAGKYQKCDDCVLFLQLGATFAFFTLSFVVAFCCHGRDFRFTRPWSHHSLSDDLYLPPDADKTL